MKFLNKFNESKENKFNVPDSIIKLAFKYVKDISEITDAYLVEGTEDLYIIHTNKELFRSKEKLKLICWRSKNIVMVINPYFEFKNKIDFESYKKELDDIMDMFFYFENVRASSNKSDYYKVGDIISDPRTKLEFYFFLLRMTNLNEILTSPKYISFVLNYYYQDENSFEELSSELIDILSKIKSYNWITKGFSINKEINSNYASVNITLGK